MVEDELLGSKRSHAVTQQNVWFARIFVLGKVSQSSHVLDELIKTTLSEVAETASRFCRQAVASVIVSVNNKFRARQYVGQFCVTANVLTKSVGDLYNATNLVLAAPFHTGDGKIVIADEVKSLWFQLRHKSPFPKCLPSHRR